MNANIWLCRFVAALAVDIFTDPTPVLIVVLPPVVTSTDVPLTVLAVVAPTAQELSPVTVNVPIEAGDAPLDS